MSRPRRAEGIASLVRRALAEDRVGRDRTTRALFPGPVPAEGVVVAQAAGVLSGMEAVRSVARTARLRLTFARRDGSRLVRGRVVARLRGDARDLLAVERTILNFLMHASGVATETARAVRAARGPAGSLEIWATRKTLPGLRDLEKAAVAHGGGHPHRRDLAAAVLVKNNHLALLPIRDAVRRARRAARPHEPVEVEIRTARQALAAARAGATTLLIDNATPTRARAIVRALQRAGLRRGRRIELSGGITPDRVRRYRSTGADMASLGALTHSAPALPFHLSLRRTTP
ncbi:MAG TPA: carboxylating nicotinate-nucleotide diphosphorylase [Thermoplasmata archaeon]|nr:carboxylating nicotinate-nucleotide diphosphorylase [Thermoplasmata archaeon]